jgi:hypothetical protein
MSFEYLDHHIMTSGIHPLTSEVEVIQQLKLSNILKQLRSPLELMNHCRDMWKQRSHKFTPLMELTTVPRGSKLFEWKERENKASKKLKVN